MEEHGIHQEGEEEEPSNPENLEGDLSANHLSKPEPLAHPKKKRMKPKKKPKTNDKASDHTPKLASTSNPSIVTAEQGISPTIPVKNPKQSMKVFTDESRIATCHSIIEAMQRKVLNLRRGEFDDIYKEFKQLCEISWSITKGEMSRLLIGYRDPARVVILHNCISEFPSEIPALGLPKTIEILTKAVRELLLIFPDVMTAFGRYEHDDPSERVQGRRSIDMMKKFYKAKEAEWKRFDVQVAGSESTISRFEKEMELIKQGKKWTAEAQREMLETEKKKTEKLIKEMMKKEREKCDAIGCPCVEKERQSNSIVAGLGTMVKDTVDRKKIVEILNGKEH